MPNELDSILIHKYSQRALFLLTDRCAGHCMYCFRQDVLAEMHQDELPELERRLSKVLAYLKQHPEVEEIILSGGDPLNVPFRFLEKVFDQLKAETSVTEIRIHTRNVVFAPKVLSEKVCELLGRHRARIFLHIVHPYELTEEVVAGIKRLQSYGVRCYSQFPILRGINDHPAVLQKLLRELDELDARPINLFIPDPIFYSATFRVSLDRLFGLMDNLYWSTSSWTNGVRIVLDTPVGKVRREDVKGWDKETGKVAFEREGEQILYQDFPAELDIPGDVDTMLWQG
ncbi:MAG: radical SAM protein [Chloroflexota bacterium]